MRQVYFFFCVTFSLCLQRYFSTCLLTGFDYSEIRSVTLCIGGTPLNNPLIDFCALFSKSKLHVTIFWQFSFNFMEAIFTKFNKKSIFWNFISRNLELRTVKQRHPYFHPSRTPPHHFRPRTNCRGLLSKPNQEPPFCDMHNIDQLPIS